MSERDLPSSAISSMPWDSTSIIFFGARFETNTTFFPMSSSLVNELFIPATIVLFSVPRSRVSTNIGFFVSMSCTSATSQSTKNTSTTTITAPQPPASTTTTTSSSSSANESLALNLIKTNSYYALMQNYSSLYTNAANNCTSSLYNSSYLAKYGSNPPAGSYQNAKSNSPSGISMSESVKGSVVSFTYKSVSSAPSLAGTVLVLNVDESSSAISNSTFSGIFTGFDYQTMLSNYKLITSVGNACGIYVV